MADLNRRRFTATHAAVLEDQPHPSPLASHPYVLPPQSFTDLDIPQTFQHASRPHSAITHTSYLGGDLHGTYDRDDIESQNREDMRALIEFFKNTAPPSSSFMSKPYDNEEDRGRWSAFRDLAKKRTKSMGRPPQQIHLPDSAVSGTTTGGHRHIAISIPLEASPFGERPRSQYPVYSKDTELPPLPPPKPSIKTFVNEKGVVTVLRAVAEDHEADTVPNSAASYRTHSREPSSRPTSEHKSISRSHSQQSKSSLRERRPDGTRALPPPLAERPLLQNRSRTVSLENGYTRSRSSSGGSAFPYPNSEFRRAVYPARGSSMAANRKTHRPADSIDSIIAQQHERSPSPIPAVPQLPRRMGNRRPGTREGPPVSLTTCPLGRKSTPNLRGDYTDMVEPSYEVPKRGTRVTVITDKPVVTQMDDSPPPTPVSAMNRRDKVKDKKRRDMEAARLARESKHMSQADSVMSDQRSSSQSLAKEQEPVSQPKLTGIMVVVNVEPESEPVEEPSTEAEQNVDEDAEDEMETEPTASRVAEMRPESLLALYSNRDSIPNRETASPSPDPSELNLNEPGPLVKTGNPTPPDSTNNSPAQRFGFDDRTSLTRRREWSAFREQERKRRETEQVNTKVQKLAAAGMSYERIKALNPEEKMVKLYEAYREHRMLDIDRRLRRLERNGDAWMQSLIPLLDNMNRNMETMNTRREQELLRDCASDDEMSVEPERFNRMAENRRLTRRSSLSQGRMQEQMNRCQKTVSWDIGNDNGSNDSNGLGALDSIMRELAAESRMGRTVQFAGHGVAAV